jgi:hypothetical protein
MVLQADPGFLVAAYIIPLRSGYDRGIQRKPDTVLG